jgi:hypothetical protein
VLIGAWRGSGKSFLALAISGSVSTSRDTFWGRKVNAHGPMIYVAHEGVDGLQERVKAWEKTNGVRLDHVLWWTRPLDITVDQMRVELELAARSIGAVGIILDPARTTGFKSEDPKDGAAYALALGRLQLGFGGVVIVLQNSGYDRTRERGSTMVGDSCDAVFNITKAPGGIRKITAGRLKESPADDDDDALITFRVESVPGTRSAVMVPAEDQIEAAASSLRDRIFKLIEATPGMSTSETANLLELDVSNTSTHLKFLEKDGRVVNRGQRNRASWYPCDPSQAL